MIRAFFGELSVDWVTLNHKVGNWIRSNCVGVTKRMEGHTRLQSTHRLGGSVSCVGVSERGSLQSFASTPSDLRLLCPYRQTMRRNGTGRVPYEGAVGNGFAPFREQFAD